MDYPFNLKGILYFPKLRNEFETMEGQIKLYNNQAFVADNIKEVIPEWLLLLKGVIDCPDLPSMYPGAFCRTTAASEKYPIISKSGRQAEQHVQTERENYEKY